MLSGKFSDASYRKTIAGVSLSTLDMMRGPPACPSMLIPRSDLLITFGRFHPAVQAKVECVSGRLADLLVPWSVMQRCVLT